MSSLLPFSLQESYEVSLVSLDSVGEPASPSLLPPAAAADAAATAATAESMLVLLLLLLLLLPFLSRFGEALGDDLGDALGDPAGRRPELLLLLPARVPDLVVLRLPLVDDDCCCCCCFCLVLLRLLSPLLRCCLLWLPPLLPLPLLGRRDDDLCGLGTASSAASGPPIAAAAADGSGRSASPDDGDEGDGAECLPLPFFSDLDDFFLCCLELPPLVVEVLRPSLRVPLLLFLFPPRLLRDGDEAVVAVLAGADSGAAVASSSPPIPDEASGSGFSQPSPRGIVDMECYAIPRMREGGVETCQLLSPQTMASGGLLVGMRSSKKTAQAASDNDGQDTPPK